MNVRILAGTSLPAFHCTIRTEDELGVHTTALTADAFDVTLRDAQGQVADSYRLAPLGKPARTIATEDTEMTSSSAAAAPSSSYYTAITFIPSSPDLHIDSAGLYTLHITYTESRAELMSQLSCEQRVYESPSSLTLRVLPARPHALMIFSLNNEIHSQVALSLRRFVSNRYQSDDTSSAAQLDTRTIANQVQVVARDGYNNVVQAHVALHVQMDVRRAAASRDRLKPCAG